MPTPWFTWTFTGPSCLTMKTSFSPMKQQKLQLLKPSKTNRLRLWHGSAKWSSTPTSRTIRLKNSQTNWTSCWNNRHLNNRSCYKQKAADLVNKMVSKAKLNREDFPLALNLAYNTSYQSSISSSPFELLYGYAPRLPTTNLEAAISASTFAQERLLRFKRVLQDAEKELADDKSAQMEKVAESFVLYQKNPSDNNSGWDLEKL